MSNLLPMKLQLFAESNNQQQGDGQGSNQQQEQNQPAGTGQQGIQIDYEKLAQVVAGKQAVAEDQVLKGYFKQQGLSQEEAAQAIAAFKQQKAANQPDVGAIQTQLTQEQAARKAAEIQSAATMAAVSLGIDIKAIPHVLKIADFSKVAEQDGKINDDLMKEAINKVLEDVPAFKPQPDQSKGFVQIGASGQGSNQGGGEGLSLRDAVSQALKK